MDCGQSLKLGYALGSLLMMKYTSAIVSLTIHMLRLPSSQDSEHHKLLYTHGPIWSYDTQMRSLCACNEILDAHNWLFAFRLSALYEPYVVQEHSACRSLQRFIGRQVSAAAALLSHQSLQALQDSPVRWMILQHCMSLLIFKRLSQLVTRSNMCCATSAENFRASRGHW